MDKAHQN